METRRRGSWVALVLAGAVLLGACGSDEPVDRSFDNEVPAASNAAPQLPASVPSKVTLSYKKGKFRVDVGAERDYCLAQREVVVVEQGKRKPVRVGKVMTDDEGFASLADKKAAGKFVAQLKKGPSAEYGDVSICLGGNSRPLKV